MSHMNLSKETAAIRTAFHMALCGIGFVVALGLILLFVNQGAKIISNASAYLDRLEVEHGPE